ncbi:MAG: M28 family metallopeptidase [Bacteroidales bacterium]
MTHKKKILGLLFAGLVSSLSPLKAEVVAKDSLTTLQTRFKNHITYLASPRLGGRVPMTSGDTLTVNYIKEQFIAINGVELIGENGLQEFAFAGLREPVSDSIYFSINGKKLKRGVDYQASPYSQNGHLEGEVVYWNSAKPLIPDSMDLKDKFVMIDFKPAADQSYWDLLKMHGDSVEKAKVAGLILVSNDLGWQETNRTVNRRLVIATVSPKTAAQIKNGAKVDFRSKIEHGLKKQTKSNNVVARISAPAINNPAGEAIVIGAHHDHIGRTIKGQDTTYLYGADDNASGIGMLIEMARYFASEKDRLVRDIVLVAFGAEERGLQGSRYFAGNPLVPHDSIKGMFNFDMTGRMSAKTLHIRGVGTFVEAFGTLAAAPNKNMLNLNLIMSGTEPTDYASFYKKGIPTLSFSSGRHKDFHLHTDLESKINYQGMQMIYDYVVPVISRYVIEPGRMTYIKLK